jgi:hypothetical protein
VMVKLMSGGHKKKLHTTKDRIYETEGWNRLMLASILKGGY